MAYGLVLALHVLVCVFLIVVILLQAGRGGMSEVMGGAAAQSLFGGGASNVLTKITAYVAGAFVVTCLTLATLSSLRGQSIVEQLPLELPDPSAVTAPISAPAQAPGAEPTESVVPESTPAAPASSDAPGTP